jgi:hypothetical protein
MIVLDTNVISEAFRIAPSPTVQSWLDTQMPNDLFLCTPVLAELRYGIERLPASARRAGLEQMLSAVEGELFESRILSLDRAAAYEFGRIRMAIATRDVSDFAELGLDIINPFEPAAAR